MNANNDFSIEIEEESILFGGFINFQNANQFIELLADSPLPATQQLIINMQKLAIEDGLALIVIGKAIKAMAKHVAKLVLIDPPQALAYRLNYEQPIANLQITHDAAHFIAEEII